MKNKRIKLVVSIDGGGIRGILPLMVLQHIEELFKKNDLNAFIPKIDMISGTSTGSIISAGLLVKPEENYLYSITDILNLYKIKGGQLFTLNNLSGNSSNGLSLLLKRKFQGIKLTDLNKHFLFVSYDKIQKKPFLFEEDMDKVDTIPLSLALAACSAVPTIFKPICWEDHQLIDGGVSVKNPAGLAYQKTQQLYPEETCLLLSFGTGEMKAPFYDKIEEEVQKVDDYLTHESDLNSNLKYFRFQPTLNLADPRLDNASPENINHLIEDGRSYIDKSNKVFQAVIELYKEQLSADS